MALPTFIQDSRIGRTIYQVRDGALWIATTRLGRIGGELRLALHTLSPNYRSFSVRCYPLIVVPLVTTLICACAIWGLFKQTYIPSEALGIFYHWSVLGFLGSLIALIRGVRKVEYFRFVDLRGAPAVDIIREKTQEAQCASFLLALVAHIEVARSDLQATAKTQLIKDLVPDDSSVPSTEWAPDRWLVSVALGGLAAVTPLIPSVISQLGEMAFPVVFMLSLGGICFAAYSFITNEPKKWWSVLGFVFSIIPPYFY